MKSTLPLFLVLAARIAFGADGQVLINQSTVMAAGGFPYHIKTSGSYKLSGNLVAPLDKSAMVFEADQIVLDLNGFNVSCSWDDANNSYGGSCILDNGQGVNGITIRNGSVFVKGTSPTFNYGLVTGIDLVRSRGLTVESVHFAASVSKYSANGLNAGVFSIIRHNVFTDNASPGVTCPSLLDGNVNQTIGAGWSGNGCVSVNNVGLFPQ